MAKREKRPTAEELQKAKDMAALEHLCLQTLGQGQFDTVQIIVTRHDNEGTIFSGVGLGNWFARVKSVECWLRSQ